METPYGVLHQPKHGIVQFVCLAAGLFGGPVLGELIGQRILGLSENAQIAFYIPFVAILFLGYGLWTARLNAIAFDLIGRGLLKALFLLLVRRRKPRNLEEILPSKEKLLRMAVRAQKAAWSFLHASVPVAAVTVLIAVLVSPQAMLLTKVAAVGGGLLLWGCFLSLLGRHGYLPIAENSG